MRLDKWLWYARFLKTRSLASQFVKAGKVRINGVRTSRASALIHIGDVLTFPLNRPLPQHTEKKREAYICIVEITHLPHQRSMASQPPYCIK